MLFDVYLLATGKAFPGKIVLPRQEKRRGRGKAGLAAIVLGSLVAAAPIRGVTPRAYAQQADSNAASDKGLPDAPRIGAAAGSSDHDPSTHTTSASMSGTVLDTNGDVIQGARVTLQGPVSGGERVELAGSNGEFIFSGLPPGTFRLTVGGTGMGTYVSSNIQLSPGDFRLVPHVVLPIIAAAISVRVYANRNELAEEEVHLEVQQRVLGVLPNFYSTYDWNAPPLGTKQKFELAFRAVIDPVAFAGAGFLASVEQANNTYPAYGQGIQGYSKRFGAAYANDFTGRMLASALLPSVFHQDPRYFYKGSGRIRSRAFYAISAAVITRGDNGQWQPNYSHVLGSFAAGGISNLYYPAANRGVSLTIVNGLIETAGNAGNNLLREFLFRRMTPKVPSYESGKP